ncbi:hypothetical protein EYF80_022408 [Liparis tanakae]|uniref:Uncharacterized protein n=1 Tax=Liparis tanakae TaxID=230148 RepID=A0A4Z2HP09_9TELE|nr:hypothetical protein EYF80_022408 [Liparis tanakae]
MQCTLEQLSSTPGPRSNVGLRAPSSGPRRSCFPSRQSNSLHLPLITSLVPHYLHLVFMPVSPVAFPSLVPVY